MATQAAVVSIPAGVLLANLADALVSNADLGSMVMWSPQDLITQAFTYWDGMPQPIWSLDIALYDTNKAELTVGNSPGYARLNVNAGSTNFSLGADKLTISNAVALNFVAATANWATAVYAGFYLHGDGVTQYGSITGLTSSVAVLSGNNLQFAIGAFVITQPGG